MALNVNAPRPLARVGTAVRNLAAAIGIVVALAVPGLFAAIGYLGELRLRQYEARLAAERVATYAYVQGASWRFSEHRIAELLSFVAPTGEAAHKVVKTANGEPVAQSGPVQPSPRLMVHEPIVAGAETVGQVQVEIYLGPLLTGTALAFLLGALLGLAIYAAASSLPLRALRRTATELESAQLKLHEANETLERRVRDRTAQLEEATAVAERASTAKSQFLANMSHEIRTPLNGVLGMLDVLRGTRLDAEQQRFARNAQVSGQALSGLINDVLDLSKIEAGKIALERIEFVPQEVLDTVVDGVADAASAKSLELTVFADQLLQESVIGDPGRLRQVLINLVGNAIKFTPVGEVAIEARVIRDGTDGRVLRFEVRDTGVGIEPGAQQSIFDSFTQADSSTTRRFGGTGLGLAIARQFVTLQGGEMGVVSAPGAGATFWFTLPVGRGSGSVSTTAPNVLAGRPIAVIADRAGNRTILKHYLDDTGAATTAFAALDVALRELMLVAQAGRHFAAAIVDLVLPAGQLASVADEIRSASSSTAVIFARGPGAGGSPGAGFSVVAKPVRRGALRQGVMDALERKSPVPLPAAAATVPTVAPFNARVLLVEDNAINREVAWEVLTRLGCRVDVATDGRQAVAACAEQAFDVVFMDCQMPVMDGFEATRILRAREQAAGAGRRLPIIALTANAMASDRDACLAAGMDDFLPKPFTRAAMVAKLERHARHGVTAARAGASVAENADALDESIAGTMRRERPDLWARLTRLFGEERAKADRTISAALARGDAAAVRLAAHSMKSAAANVGAPGLSEAYRALEHAASSGMLDGAAALVEAIAAEGLRVAHAMEITPAGKVA